jgi:hypothetical protein
LAVNLILVEIKEAAGRGWQLLESHNTKVNASGGRFGRQ